MKISLPDSISGDSIKQAADTSLFTSLLDGKGIATEILPQTQAPQSQPFWIFGILFMGFILLAWSRIFFRRRMNMIFSGIFGRNYANQLIREGNLFNERIGLVLFLVYLGMMPLFAYLATPLLNPGSDLPSGGMLYLLLLAFFVAFWLVKVILINSLALLFNTREHSNEILANMYLYNLFAGILLLPLLSCMAYANREVFFYITLGIIALIYIIRIFRIVMIGFGMPKFSVFHLFLYLCTLEILPLIVLAKILNRNMIL